ncbi:MAG: acetyl-CoA carboxylase biotin carboxyl carrier protein [Bacteroidia bacterium]
MDSKFIMELLRFVNKSDIHELVLETSETKLTIRRGGAPMPTLPTSPPAIQAPSAQAAPMEETEKKTPAPPAPSAQTHIIRSPMVGTYYRTPAPDKEPFVKVGDVIQKGQVVCIIEAMKLFNEIEADVSGRITKILVENATPVEFDQPLFEVELL